jgi:hypothetical protein
VLLVIDGEDHRIAKHGGCETEEYSLFPLVLSSAILRLAFLLLLDMVPQYRTHAAFPTLSGGLEPGHDLGAASNGHGHLARAAPCRRPGAGALFFQRGAYSRRTAVTHRAGRWDRCLIVLERFMGTR